MDRLPRPLPQQVARLLWQPNRAAYGQLMGGSKRGRSCAHCGKPVGDLLGFGVCRQCGARAWPSLDYSLTWGSLRLYGAGVALLILGVIAIGAYAVSDEGRARLPELAALVGGPILIVVVGWVAYRTWYRRRYPDD